MERRSSHPMLPLELFRSRQFAAATALALVTYAALGGVIFLFVAFLQISLGYTALQAGAATLPVTLLLLTLSSPSGAIAQHIGPRIPLTAGAILTGAGLLLMAQIRPGDSYLAAVLPSLAVFRHLCSDTAPSPGPRWPPPPTRRPLPDRRRPSSRDTAPQLTCAGVLGDLDGRRGQLG